MRTQSVREGLLQELKQVCGADGSLGFDRFMDVVLYHPTLGYYTRSAERAARHGDFLTSPEVTPLFGACVASWIDAAWKTLGGGPLDLVEVGAGRGTLAASIQAAASPDLAAATTWHLVERGTTPRAALRQRFLGDERVRVYETVDELPPRFERGIFVANELFDNLPVRRLMMADGWKEVRLRLEGQRFRERLEPAEPSLVSTAQEHGLKPQEGQTVEVCPGAVPLLESILGRFRRGALLVFDYGGLAHEVSGDAAPHGTLAAHRGHGTVPDLYASLGEQDITAHVNFTPLIAAAERLGYRPGHLTTQASFLLGHGLPERLQERLAAARDDYERLRLTQLAKQLYHPEAMGEAYRVLRATNAQ